jgi:hypothetical protein
VSSHVLRIRIFIVRSHQILGVWVHWHITVILEIGRKLMRIYLSRLGLYLSKLVVLVLLNHHVDSFLGVLKIEFVKLTSIGCFTFIITLLFWSCGFTAEGVASSCLSTSAKDLLTELLILITLWRKFSCVASKTSAQTWRMRLTGTSWSSEQAVFCHAIHQIEWRVLLCFFVQFFVQIVNLLVIFIFELAFDTFILNELHSLLFHNLLRRRTGVCLGWSMERRWKSTSLVWC